MFAFFYFKYLRSNTHIKDNSHNVIICSQGRMCGIWFPAFTSACLEASGWTMWFHALVAFIKPASRRVRGFPSDLPQEAWSSSFPSNEHFFKFNLQNRQYWRFSFQTLHNFYSKPNFIKVLWNDINPGHTWVNLAN